MKKEFVVVALLVCVIGFSGFPDGPANRVGLGFTGAPCEDGRVCQGCHAGLNYTQPISSITLTDQLTGEVTQSYKPGRAYIVRISIASTSLIGFTNPRYGMQMTAIDPDFEDVGTWSQPSFNAQISSADVTCGDQVRTYVEHTFASFGKNFSAVWEAPMCSQDTVTFFHIGNAVNGDGGTSGDRGGTGEFTIVPVDLTEHLELTDLDSVNGFYRAIDSITISNTIRDNADVILTASQAISLKPIFEIKVTSQLTIAIDTCN